MINLLDSFLFFELYFLEIMDFSFKIHDFHNLEFVSMWNGHNIGWTQTLGAISLVESLLLFKVCAPTITNIVELKVADFT